MKGLQLVRAVGKSLWLYLCDQASEEEATAVFNVLSTFENMIEVKPEVAELAVEKTKVGRSILEVAAIVNLL